MKYLKPLPISEEMLGAYLEGNLSAEESLMVQGIIDSDNVFKDFVSELSVHDSMIGGTFWDVLSAFDTEFELPSIPESGYQQPFILSPEPVEDFLIAPDVSSEEDISLMHGENPEIQTIERKLTLFMPKSNNYDNSDDLVDDTIGGFTEVDMRQPKEINGSDVDYLTLDGDSISDNGHLYHQEDINTENHLKKDYEALNNSETMVTSYRTYGEFGENIYDPIYIKQPDDHSCGLRSQQIVLRDFGIDIPFKDLEKYALDAGVYGENGTYTYDIGKVLEMAGVGMHQVEGSTIYDLTNELAQGHRVIVSVDAHELWYKNSVKGKLLNWFNDVFGSQGGNHALIVAGVEVNPQNPDDAKAVLTDPGAGHLRIEYPLNQFIDAWKDSNCFMAATDEPAPYQYDVETGMEVPSNYVVNHHYNHFVVENCYKLNPDMINVPVGYQPAFTGHMDMIGDMTYDDYLSQHLLSRHDYDNSTFHGDNSMLSEGEAGEYYGMSGYGEGDGNSG